MRQPPFIFLSFRISRCDGTLSQKSGNRTGKPLLHQSPIICPAGINPHPGNTIIAAFIQNINSYTRRTHLESK